MNVAEKLNDVWGRMRRAMNGQLCPHERTRWPDRQRQNRLLPLLSRRAAFPRGLAALAIAASTVLTGCGGPPSQEPVGSQLAQFQAPGHVAGHETPAPPVRSTPGVPIIGDQRQVIKTPTPTSTPGPWRATKVSYLSNVLVNVVWGEVIRSDTYLGLEGDLTNMPGVMRCISTVLINESSGERKFAGGTCAIDAHQVSPIFVQPPNTNPGKNRPQPDPEAHVAVSGSVQVGIPCLSVREVDIRQPMAYLIATFAVPGAQVTVSNPSMVVTLYPSAVSSTLNGVDVDTFKKYCDDIRVIT